MMVIDRSFKTLEANKAIVVVHVINFRAQNGMHPTWRSFKTLG